MRNSDCGWNLFAKASIGGGIRGQFLKTFPVDTLTGIGYTDF
ncbi:hypothetical protein D1BOALGB6SA_274 [Olavius sp. associated proteobacterium Delta 1]|nr:hypothetical protein D1BOALGB6SA_274 [Olavius sp. associated proteobacterium Delta 1]